MEHSSWCTGSATNHYFKYLLVLYNINYAFLWYGINIKLTLWSALTIAVISGMWKWQAIIPLQKWRVVEYSHLSLYSFPLLNLSPTLHPESCNLSSPNSLLFLHLIPKYYPLFLVVPLWEACLLNFYDYCCQAKTHLHTISWLEILSVFMSGCQYSKPPILSVEQVWDNKLSSNIVQGVNGGNLRYLWF